MTEIYDIDPVLVDVPMPIMTSRLLIRPPQAGDGEAVHQAKKESWKELSTWMPWASGDFKDHTVEKDEIMCRQKYAQHLLREDLMMLVFNRQSNALVASSGLHRMDWRARIFEIGYWVSTPHAGQGYATETTNALLRYAFIELKANRAYIAHDEENNGSRRVIEKLGFIKEGHTQKSDIRNGQLANTLHYARYDLEGLPALDVSWEGGPL